MQISRLLSAARQLGRRSLVAVGSSPGDKLPSVLNLGAEGGLSKTALKLRPTFTRPHRELHRATLKAVLPPPGSAGEGKTGARPPARRGGQVRVAGLQPQPLPQRRENTTRPHPRPQTPGRVPQPSESPHPLHSRPRPELVSASVRGCERSRPTGSQQPPSLDSQTPRRQPTMHRAGRERRAREGEERGASRAGGGERGGERRAQL